LPFFRLAFCFAYLLELLWEMRVLDMCSCHCCKLGLLLFISLLCVVAVCLICCPAVCELSPSHPYLPGIDLVTSGVYFVFIFVFIVDKD